MKTTKLKDKLDKLIDQYTDLFCKKQDVDADGWIGDLKGGINCFSDAFLSFDDIRTDIDLEVPKGMIFNWYWDSVESGLNINYQSYIRGLRVADIQNKESKELFIKHWNIATNNKLIDKLTLQNMQYCIDAIKEGLTKNK